MVRAQPVEIVDGELVHHLDQAAAADLVAGRQRVEIANHLDRLAHIDGDDVYQRLVDLAFAREAHQRDVEAFLVHLAGVGAHAAAANIDHVAGAGEQRHHLAAPEGRRDEGEVVQMAGALPGVVGQEDVAFLHHLGRELVEEVAHRARHRVDMPGRAGDGLRQHGAVEIEHAGREVAGFACRGREAGADQGQRLLLDDRDQAVPHQLQANGRKGIVDAHVPTFSNRMAPIGLMRAAKLLGTMVVVSSSAMTAGPGTKLPIVRSAR
jgi:hypothetical protein